jgi:hypothetical protein
MQMVLPFSGTYHTGIRCALAILTYVLTCFSRALSIFVVMRVGQTDTDVVRVLNIVPVARG